MNFMTVDSQITILIPISIAPRLELMLQPNIYGIFYLRNIFNLIFFCIFLSEINLIKHIRRINCIKFFIFIYMEHFKNLGFSSLNMCIFYDFIVNHLIYLVKEAEDS